MRVNAEPVAVRGFRFSGVSAGLKKVAGAKDLGLIVADAPAPATAVFSANQRQGGARLRHDGSHPRRPLASGGRELRMRQQLHRQAGPEARDAIRAQSPRRKSAATPKLVVPSSTGVIGHLFDLEKFAAGVREAASELRPEGMEDFARAIMTTDTRPKIASVTIRIAGAEVTIAGVAKGAGMISPKMATMLAYLVTDAAVSSAQLKAALKAALPHSFNAITVDGDMSTNDTVILMASGAAGNRALSRKDLDAFNAGVEAVSAATRARTGLRWRGRDQAGDRRGQRREVSRRCRALCAANRQFTAGQDGVLRKRSQRRPHPDGGGIVGRQWSNQIAWCSRLQA